MSFKFILLLVIFNIFNFNVILDTDCVKDAGDSVDTCKKFTTFINGTNENFYIEPNVLYLCCYVDETINGQYYKGCLPIKEDVVFSENKPFKFECNSLFPKIKIFIKIISLINIFF